MVSPAVIPVAMLLAAAPSPTTAPAVIDLWPEGVPGLRPDAGPEKLVNGRFVGIHHPTLTVYPARPGTANGTAVISSPGGGYIRLRIGDNGGESTVWLNSLGVTVFVLKYRLSEYGHPAPLRDVLRAVRLVRSRAAEWGVKPDRIGVMGGSAGAHLSACAAHYFDWPEGKAGSPLAAVSARPDFAMLIYPVVTMRDPFAHQGSRTALLGATPSAEAIELLSVEKHARQDAPPHFIVATQADDTVPVENSLMLYQALRAAGVPSEMHVYAQGDHGNSLDPQYGPTAEWPRRAEEWLRFGGWLTP
jgi:acetyl esterase/lipase